MATRLYSQYVYSLLDKNRNLLYVGRTDDPAKRMRGHADIKGIDRILLTKCDFADEYEVKYVEAALINHYQPPYNSIIPTQEKVAAHLKKLQERHPNSKFLQVSPENFDIDVDMPLSELEGWARDKVATKHHVAVYLTDYEFEVFRQYCGGQPMSKEIKRLLDHEVLYRDYYEKRA